MNRRLFLNSLLGAGIGATVAYSFPSIIVPKNIVVPELVMGPLYYHAPRGLAWLINENMQILNGINSVQFWPTALSWQEIRIQYQAATWEGVMR